MSFNGRFISILFVGAIIFLIRETVQQQFGQVPHAFPLPAIIAIIIAWWAGKQYDRKVHISNIDPLTSIYNRRFVVDKFPLLVKNATRKKHSIATILIDVNDFKGINDTYGHAQGDRVLIGIAQVLKDSFDRKDIIARWGGDEFIIFSTFDEENKVLSKLKLLYLLLENQNVLPDEKLSVSVGIAYFPKDASSMEELVSKADANMYEIKSEYKITQVI